MLRCLGAMLVAGAVGCGGGHSSASAAGSPQFVAVQGDFVAYHSWTSFPAGTQDIDGIHTMGQRTVYINRLPSHGSTEFSQGTIIVKDVPGGQTFAMAKRGGGFNPDGAVGWEWFQLMPNANGTPVIVWRGVAPPDGSAVNIYSDTTPSACNDCHMNAGGNDYVHAPPLQLSQF